MIMKKYVSSLLLVVITLLSGCMMPGMHGMHGMHGQHGSDEKSDDKSKPGDSDKKPESGDTSMHSH